MAFTTSGQETEWALFLQPRNPHGAIDRNQRCGTSFTSLHRTQISVGLPSFLSACTTLALSLWLSWLIRFLSHSTCWVYLADDLQRPGIKSGSRHELSVGWTNDRYAISLISRTGTEGPPVSSLNCDRCRLWSYDITAVYKCEYYYYYYYYYCAETNQGTLQPGYWMVEWSTKWELTIEANFLIQLHLQSAW